MVSVELKPEPRVTIAYVKGRIDHQSADAFRDGLAPALADCRADAQSLVLECSGLEYISSAGLRVLMLAAKQTRPNGGRIAVAALQPVVEEIFKISRFDLVFPVHARLEEARSSVVAP